ncbi:hypothetical protein LEMLEM_LOCUS20098, partial [Lemmus lemmus]
KKGFTWLTIPGSSPSLCGCQGSRNLKPPVTPMSEEQEKGCAWWSLLHCP